MPPLKVNFSDVQTSNFDPLPAGTYVCNVTNYEMREAGEQAKNPGSPYINWEFTVIKGEFDNRKLWSNTSLLPQALFSLKGLMEASGRYSREQLDGDLEFDPDDLVSATVKVVVRQREYPPGSGDMTNDVKGFRKFDDADASSGSAASLLP